MRNRDDSFIWYRLYTQYPLNLPNTLYIMTRHPVKPQLPLQVSVKPADDPLATD